MGRASFFKAFGRRSQPSHRKWASQYVSAPAAQVRIQSSHIARAGCGLNVALLTAFVVDLQFLMYEKSSLAFDSVWRHWGAALLPQHDASLPEDIFSAQAQLRSAFAGAMGGTLGKLAVYPLDTVKKRLQVGGMQRAERYARTRVYNGALHALMSIAREEGIVHGLYRGTLPSLAKASAAASLSFWSYELVLRTLVKIAPSSILHPGAPDEGDV